MMPDESFLGCGTSGLTPFFYSFVENTSLRNFSLSSCFCHSLWRFTLSILFFLGRIIKKVKREKENAAILVKCFCYHVN